MNNFNDIETIWRSATPLRFSGMLPEDIIYKAEKTSREVRNKILRQVTALLLAVPLAVYILFTVPFDYSSSYAGIALMLVCILAFSYVRLRQVLFLKQLDFSQPPAKLLLKFERFYTRQQWIHTKGAIMYSIIVNLAFALYFYETVYMAPLPAHIKWIILAGYCIWMFGITYWIGKKSVHREMNKTKSVIAQLKRLSAEFT